MVVISHRMYLRPSSSAIKPLTKNIQGHDSVIFLQIYGLHWCRGGHAEVNGLDGWLLFRIESGQTDVDENICQSGVLGVMVTTDMPSN